MDADRIVDKWRAQALGLRWNNPGNLRPSKDKWVGEIEPLSGYCRFDTPEHGLRAMAKDLLAKYRRGLVTVTSIIRAYAPPEENDTEAYIAAVCRDAGVLPYAWLQLTDPSVLAAMVVAIVKHENGQCPYDGPQIAGAVAAALA